MEHLDTEVKLFRRSLASEEEAIVAIYGGLLRKLNICRNITLLLT